ncbi:MAG: hypothetical protein JW838_14525 [Spirochaetes bacterium]|nr:hypothetical protein [Spirochaetota bacterium]
MKKTVLRAALVCLVFTCAGCSLHSIPANYALQPGKESIVIGALRFPDSGIPFLQKPIHGTYGTIRINTIIAKQYREYTVKPELVDATYRFAVALPQGRYRITEINWGELSGGIDGIFTIYETGKVYYIGSIEMEQRLVTPGQIAANYFLGALSRSRSFPLKLKIVDEYTNAMNHFTARYPNLPREAEKSLVQFKDEP